MTPAANSSPSMATSTTLAVVIRRWLEAHGRLLSPKFIVGESYGGFRGPKLARALLDKQGVGISGLFLISPVLDFNGRDAPWNPFRYVVTLPSMAAAYRHAQSRADLADVETYATGDFLSDLIRGEADTEATDRLATRVSALTGLDPALVRRRLGRIGLSTFLRDQTPGRVDSPYDATISAADPFPAAANDNSPDPILDGLRAPVTSAALYIYKTWLEWQPEGAPNRQYELLNDQIAHEWDYGRRMTRPDAYSDLRQYLALDPTSRAVIAHGLTDLVTPYFADALLLRQTPDFNGKHQLSLVVYPGGHMFLLARRLPCRPPPRRSRFLYRNPPVKYFCALSLLTLSACGYHPPPQTNTASPAYVADRDACEDKSTADVNKTDAKTALAWFGSPFHRWSQIADATQSCMAGKGYGRVRWCTPEELRSGNRQGGMIVTASGVQCSDPPTHPTDTFPPATGKTAPAAMRSQQ